jgi:hypothetical protein
MNKNPFMQRSHILSSKRTEDNRFFNKSKKNREPAKLDGEYGPERNPGMKVYFSFLLLKKLLGL